jgi:hypothetical protein
LYDIWNAFGAEHSLNSEFDFNEGSNDFIYDLITSIQFDENGDQVEEGKYLLKDKMIHVLSNKTAIKSGATNLNPKNA